MARAAFVLRIRPDQVQQYVEAHHEVWPEMREAIRRAGIRNYTIFLHGHEAIGYLEADDVDESFSRLAEEAVNGRWQLRMARHLVEGWSDAGPGLLPEIFRLD